MTIELHGSTVNQIYRECLFTEDDLPSDKLIIPGITQESTFSKTRIRQNRSKIHDLLSQLFDEFKQSRGRGASFQNFNLDSHGDPWVGNFDRNEPQEQLLQLGQAIQEALILDFHYDWASLGGVPRILIKQ